MLLLRGRDDGRMALPLSKLERLEEFAASEVQRTGSRMVVKYRDGVLALVGVSELLEERRGEARSTDIVASSESKIQVVICTAGDHEVGLVTDRVLDIVRVSTSNLAGSTREGVLGTVIINDAITELLDVDLLLTKARDMGLDLAECSLRV
jgi:two-component system chemotaxis sensor kinase CheA